MKYFLPPPQKAQGYERSRYGYTHMCLFIAAAFDLDFTRSTFSDSALWNYKVTPSSKIIVLV